MWYLFTTFPSEKNLSGSLRKDRVELRLLGQRIQYFLACGVKVQEPDSLSVMKCKPRSRVWQVCVFEGLHLSSSHFTFLDTFC